MHCNTTSFAGKTSSMQLSAAHKIKQRNSSYKTTCKNSTSIKSESIGLLENSEVNIEIDEYNPEVRQHVVQVLKKYGIVLGHVKDADPEGKIFKQLVEEIGEIDTHDEKGTRTWDVKFDPSVNQQTGTRSLTLREFEMHTDASFELPPPKYICLYVVKEDSLGGGVSQIIEGRKLLARLSSKTKQILQSLYTVRVPDEFYKDRHFEQVPILDADMNFAFRRDIIVRDMCSKEQLEALQELESILNTESIIESKFLHNGTMLILDNGRFLHARTEVKDKDRHLLRMRFQPNAAIFGILEMLKVA
jgi:alpha-ketoglutarate-dependent taurine dioxygenase